MQVYLSNIECNEETDELSSADEPYVLVTAVNLNGPIPSYDVIRYGPFDDVDEDEIHYAPGRSQSFWGINGNSAPLDDPDKAIFLVSLLEHDAGRPGTLQGIVKGIVASSVLGSLTLDRNSKVDKLMRDVSSALGTPSGPSLDQDDTIGGPVELKFSRDELMREKPDKQ